jgi:hypothetical protein
MFIYLNEFCLFSLNAVAWTTTQSGDCLQQNSMYMVLILLFLTAAVGKKKKTAESLKMIALLVMLTRLKYTPKYVLKCN